MTDKNFCPQCGKEIIFKPHHKRYGTPIFCSSSCSSTYTFKGKKRSEQNCMNSSIGQKKRYEDPLNRKISSDSAKNRVIEYPQSVFQKGYTPWNKNLTKNEDERLQTLGNNSGKSRKDKKRGKNPKISQKMMGNTNYKNLTPDGRERLRQNALRNYHCFARKKTSIELKLENEFKKRDIEFTQQVVILNKYRVDFLIEDFIIIEADGDYWHNLPYIKEKDKKRDKVMIENGFTIFRFWEHEINDDVSKCVDKIIEKYHIT